MDGDPRTAWSSLRGYRQPMLVRMPAADGQVVGAAELGQRGDLAGARRDDLTTLDVRYELAETIREAGAPDVDAEHTAAAMLSTPGLLAEWWKTTLIA